MLQELEQDNLLQIIGEHPRMLVQYSTSWCGNCWIMKPKFEKLLTDINGVYFVICSFIVFFLLIKLVVPHDFF